MLTTLTSKDETSPRRQSVIRSPKQAAIGGAMLSVELNESDDSIVWKVSRQTRIKGEFATEDDQSAHERPKN